MTFLTKTNLLTRLVLPQNEAKSLIFMKYISLVTFDLSLKGTVMQIEKTVINVRLRFRKYPENFAF